MIILIAGSSHTGKTLLAQRLLEKYNYPYLSIDHLKMGLIRSNYCSLSPESSDEELTNFLWPIVKEIIKTNIENNQNLIIEGCYIPFNYKDYFNDDYLKHIKYVCLIFSSNYIEDNFFNIKRHANVIESRIDDTYCTKELLLEENINNLNLCKKYGCDYILIKDSYDIDFNL